MLHSCDRLILVILLDWFRYYQATRGVYRDSGRAFQVDEAYVKMTRRAHGMWEAGMVEQIKGAESEYDVTVDADEGG